MSKTMSTRIMISVPEDFLKKIDYIAGEENRSRSELIREALRNYMYRSKNNAKNSEANAKKLVELLED